MNPRNPIARSSLKAALRDCTNAVTSALRDERSNPILAESFERWRTHVNPLYAEPLSQSRALAALGRFLRRELTDSDEAARAVYGLHGCVAAAALHLAQEAGLKVESTVDLAEDLFLKPAIGAGLQHPNVLPASAVKAWLDRGGNASPEEQGQGTTELVRDLFHRTIPAAVRYSFGEYHTPSWLARTALTELPEPFWSRGKLLDPGCGSGVFLTSALMYWSSMGVDAGQIVPRIRGFDISPLAVFLSRVNLALVFHRLGYTGDVVAAAASCVLLNDSILGRPHPGGGPDRFEAVVGNPPWVRWECLAPSYREEIKKLVPSRTSLFTEKGLMARLGGASDDLLTVFTALTCERYLAHGGTLAFLVKQTLLTNRTGRSFRTLGVSGLRGHALGFKRVHDLTRLKGLFGGGQQQTALVAAELGSATRYPVEYRVFEPTADGPRLSVTLEASPRSEKDPGSAWLVKPAGGHSDLAPLEGPSAYGSRIRHGLKHDAEKVFALRIVGMVQDGVHVTPKGGGKNSVVEPDRIFPYIKPRHVRRWRLAGWEHILVPQEHAGQDNEEELKRALPLTYGYLEHHAAQLKARRSSVFKNGPFYSFFGLGPYTWAEHRVVWCGLGHRPEFVVVSAVNDPVLGIKQALPDGGCYLIAADSEREAHYLAGMLNSGPVRRTLELCACGTKRALSKTALSRIALPAFDPNNPTMLEVAELAAEAASTTSSEEQVGLENKLARNARALL